MSTAAQEFLRNAVQKSADLRHRQIIRRGIDLYNAAAERGQARFRDWAVARQSCQIIKWEAINHLNRYLLEFEQPARHLGINAPYAAFYGALAAFLVACVGFGMPLGSAFSAFGFGCLSGFLAIIWIIIGAIFLYNMTLMSGKFEIVKESIIHACPTGVRVCGQPIWRAAIHPR